MSETNFDVSIRQARARFTDVTEAQIAAYLSQQPDIVSVGAVRDLKILTEGSGMSNGIAFFAADIDTGSGVRARDYVLRYSPGVSLIKQKNFEHEYLTMRAAEAGGLPVASARWYDDGSLLGAAGFTMERVDAEAPASSIYTSGPIATASPAERHAMLIQAAELQGWLRASAIGPDRVPHLLKRGKGEGDIARELNWWLDEARLNTDDEDPRMQLVQAVHAWMVDNQPPVRPASLTHGDGQICNIMFRRGRAAAWLDWELAYLGHQESDLMMILMNVILTRPPGTEVEGIPSENEFVARFEREAGSSVEAWPYFKLFMVYKYLVGVIFAGDLFPESDAYWRQIVTYLDDVWPQAKADRRVY